MKVANDAEVPVREPATHDNSEVLRRSINSLIVPSSTVKRSAKNFVPQNSASMHCGAGGGDGLLKENSARFPYSNLIPNKKDEVTEGGRE